jgi:hypothetical protein
MKSICALPFSSNSRAPERTRASMSSLRSISFATALPRSHSVSVR